MVESPRRAGLIAMLAVLLVYAGVLVSGPFGYNDDYQYLQRVYAGTFDPAHNEQVGMGRPAASWMIEAAYSLCGGSVRNLVYLRLVTLAGIAWLSLTLYRTLRRNGQGGTAALAVTAGVAFSPACGVYAAWAAAFLSPYALTFCLLSGSLLEPRPGGRAGRWRRRTGAWLLVLLSCCLWQAAAPMVLLPTFAGLWRRVKEGASWRAACRQGEVLSAWIVVGAALATYLLGQRLAVRSGWVHGPGVDRMSLTTDLHAKVSLLGDLLRSGFASWARLHSLAWEVPTVGLTLLAVVAGVVQPAPRGGWKAWKVGAKALLAAGMLLASVAPLLVVGENNAAYRSLPVLYAVVAFLAVEGVAAWGRMTPPWLGKAAAGSLTVLLGMCGAYHVSAGIVAPNVQEYRAVTDLVRRQFNQMPAKLVYLTPPLVLLAPETMKPSWEYGLVSSPFWWVTRPFLLLIFHEQGMCPDPKLERLEIVYREAGNKDLRVLNPMGAMLGQSGVWRDDPRWGRVLAFSGGWLYSPWFGYLNIKAFPEVEHHLMKSMLYVGSQPDDLWFFKGGLGIFLTSEVSFPSLYVNDHQEWGYLVDTDFAHAAVRLPGGEELLLSTRASVDRRSIESGGSLNLDVGVGLAYNTGAGSEFTLASANTSIDGSEGSGTFDGPGIPSMGGWSRPGGVFGGAGNGASTSLGNAIPVGGFSVPVVPEPSPWALLIGGLVVTVCARFARRASTSTGPVLLRWPAGRSARTTRRTPRPSRPPIAGAGSSRSCRATC